MTNSILESLRRVIQGSLFTHTLKDFSKCYMWEENKKIREMCNQFSVKLCKQVDVSQHTFMKIAKDWFISRKRRIIADIKRLQEEGSQMDQDASDGSYSSHTSDTDDDSVETEEDLETLLQLYSTGESTVLKTKVECITGTSPPLVPIAAIQVTRDPDDGNKTPIVNFPHIDYGHRVDEAMKDVSTSATPAQPGNIHNVVHNATGK